MELKGDKVAKAANDYYLFADRLRNCEDEEDVKKLVNESRKIIEGQYHKQINELIDNKYFELEFRYRRV